MRFTSAFIHSPDCARTQSDELRITTPSPQYDQKYALFGIGLRRRWDPR